MSDLQPGREMDALVETHVMGREVSWWSLHLCEGAEEMGWFGPLEENRPDADGDMPMLMAGGPNGDPVPHRSTDISAAWEVVEKMQAEDFWAKLGRKTYSDNSGHESDPGWHAVFRCVRAGTRGTHTAFEATAPHAIALAALRAVGAIP